MALNPWAPLQAKPAPRGRRKGRPLVGDQNAELLRALQLLTTPRRRWSKTDRTVAAHVAELMAPQLKVQRGIVATAIASIPGLRTPKPVHLRPDQVPVLGKAQKRGRRARFTIDQAHRWLVTFESRRRLLELDRHRRVGDGEVVRWYEQHRGLPRQEFWRFIQQLRRKVASPRRTTTKSAR